VRLYVHICDYVLIYIYICIHIHNIYVYIYLYIFTLYTRIYIYIYIHIYVGKIVAIYRQCLFALKNEKVTAKLIRHSAIEKNHNGYELNNDVGDVYDHDKDLDLSHTNTISERRNIETNGDDKYENNQQGDELCIWLDNEISEVRGTVILAYLDRKLVYMLQLY
jgi:hypothetical protein